MKPENNIVKFRNNAIDHIFHMFIVRLQKINRSHFWNKNNLPRLCRFVRCIPRIVKLQFKSNVTFQQFNMFKCFFFDFRFRKRIQIIVMMGISFRNSLFLIDSRLPSYAV